MINDALTGYCNRLWGAPSREHYVIISIVFRSFLLPFFLFKVQPSYIFLDFPLFVLVISIIHSTGKAGHSNVPQGEHSGGSRKSSSSKIVSRISQKQNSSIPEYHVNGKKESSDCYENYLWLGPRGNGGRHLQLVYVISSLCCEGLCLVSLLFLPIVYFLLCFNFK